MPVGEVLKEKAQYVAPSQSVGIGYSDAPEPREADSVGGLPDPDVRKDGDPDTHYYYG